MKYNFNVNLVDIEGKVMEQPVFDDNGAPTKDKETLTVKKIVKGALLNLSEDENKLSGQKKFDRYDLATRINKADSDVELSIDEVSLIKKVVGEKYTPTIVGQVWPLLEQEKLKI